EKEWKGKLAVDKDIGGESGTFAFKAVVKEQGADLEGTGILSGREVRFDFTPPSAALHFGPEIATKDKLVLLKSGKVDFTVESSEPLKATPTLTFTPQGKDSVKIDLVPAVPESKSQNKWFGSIVIDAKLGNLPGLFEFEGMDLQGNVGKEITAGRNVYLRTQPPGAVAKLRAVALPAGRVRLDWTPPFLASGEPDKSASRFWVYRSDSKITSLEGLTPLVQLGRVLGYQDVPKADRDYFYTV